MSVGESEFSQPQNVTSFVKDPQRVQCSNREETGATVVVEKLDLSSLKSVRECAQKLLDTEDKIDILINNAGNFHSIWSINNPQ